MKTKTENRIWRKMQCYGSAPLIGSRHRISLDQLLTDADDGTPVGTATTDYIVIGEITEVGAHWSDPACGKAGYWVEMSFRRPKKAPAKIKFA